MRAIALILLAAAVPAFAGRLEVIARDGEQRVVGAEACFFAAGDENDAAPLDRYLAHAATTCLPADKILRLPAGRWNLFARAAGMTSTHPFVVTVPSSASDDGLQTLSVDLLPAARLDFSRVVVGEGEVAGVYFDNDGQPESVAAARPLPLGETSLLAPAGMTVLPLVARAGVPVRIGHPLFLRSDETVVAAVERDACCDVIARVMLDPAERRSLVGSKATPPRLLLIASESDPVAPSVASTGRPTPLFDEGLAVFEHVPPGRYTLRLDGADWRSDEMVVDVAPKENVTAVMAKRSLVAWQGSALEVRWSIDPAALAPAASCENAGEMPEATLRLFRCPGIADEATYATACRVVDSVSLAPTEEGSHRFRVKPGEHIAELRIGSLVSTAAAHDGQALIKMVPIVLRGTVRKGGDGVRALLQFRTGAAVTDDFGRYAAALMRLPAFAPIIVQPCDGSPVYREVPRRKLSANETYDIEIPTNELRVRVMDTVTRRAIQGSNVYAAPLGGEAQDIELFFEDMPVTDANGATAAKQLAVDTPLHVCAAADQYVTHCSDTFLLNATAQKEVTVALQPSGGPHGRITASAPFVDGVLLVLSEGRILERAPVTADGSFVLEHDYPDPIAVAITSSSNPLAAMRLERQDGILLGTMLQPHSIEIALASGSATASAAIGLIIDGIVLPRDAILSHFVPRRIALTLRRGETVIVRDVSGEIRVLLGSEVAPSPWPPVDPFSIPALVASMRSAAVDAHGRAAFD